MYESFVQAGPISSANKPNLLTRLCGQPPLFSPEQQLLNWLVGALAVALLFFAANNAIVGIPLVAPLIAGAAFYFVLYALGRFRQVPVAPLATVAFGSNILFLTLAWLANDGINGTTFYYYLSTLVGIMSVLRGRPCLRPACTTCPAPPASRFPRRVGPATDRSAPARSRS